MSIEDEHKEAIAFLRKKYNVPEGKTITETKLPPDCWREIIKSVNVLKELELTIYHE